MEHVANQNPEAAAQQPPIDPATAIARAAKLRRDDLAGRFALVRVGMEEATVLQIMGPPHRAEWPAAILWSEPEPEGSGGFGYQPARHHFRIGLQHGKVYCRQTRTTGDIYLICGNDLRFERGLIPDRQPHRAPAPAKPQKPCGSRKR